MCCQSVNLFKILTFFALLNMVLCKLVLALKLMLSPLLDIFHIFLITRNVLLWLGFLVIGRQWLHSGQKEKSRCPSLMLGDCIILYLIKVGLTWCAYYAIGFRFESEIDKH